METESYYCRNCGARLQPGAKFCSQCGQPVGKGEPIQQPTTASEPSFSRFRRRQWLLRLIERFREKGAISLERAMTAQELGLGPRFEIAMQRRLGKRGIFVEINGRYYLSEEKLKEFRNMLAARKEL